MESDPPNRVKERRLARGWSQAVLAQRAGISRAAVSAVEGARLVPSVAAALALAGALECSVEDLFGPPREGNGPGRWAWEPPRSGWRYWQAEVGGRTLRFPVESAGATASVPHDGVGDEVPAPEASRSGGRTLVVACCDPAAGLLATLYERATGLRLIALPRSSRRAVDLLAEGVVHAAGLHLSTDAEDRNAAAARERLGDGCELLRVATWEEGLAISPGRASGSVRSVVGARLRWVGREAGSGARQCLDELLPGQAEALPVVRDHRGVAEAIRSGWADVGVCLRLTGEEAGLDFLGLREEVFELCYPRHSADDPRIRALVRVVRSHEYRRLIAELPGYRADGTGEVRPAS